MFLKLHNYIQNLTVGRIKPTGDQSQSTLQSTRWGILGTGALIKGA